MKKFLLFFPIILLIIATTIIKKSTKNLDKQIFDLSENISLLESQYELVLLDYNYLTSPKKLIFYSGLYFENDLIQKKIENLNLLKINEYNFEIKKLNNNNE